MPTNVYKKTETQLSYCTHFSPKITTSFEMPLTFKKEIGITSQMLRV